MEDQYFAGIGEHERDCVALLKAAYSGHPNVTLKWVRTWSALETFGSERSGRRWVGAIKQLRAVGKITREESYDRIQDIDVHTTSGRYLETHDPRMLALDERNTAICREHGLTEKDDDFEGRPDAPEEFLANLKEFYERWDRLQGEFLRSVGEEEMIAWLERERGP